MALAQAHGAPRLSPPRSAFSLTAAIAALIGAAGCDGSTSAATPPSDSATGCAADEDLEGPSVSVTRDLMPFFSTTCAFTACHDGNGKQAGLYLGPNFLDGASTADMRKEVVSSLLARSTMAPDLHRVVPFDPSQSFLMVKIRGCQNRLGLDCTGAVAGKPCGDRMPALSDALSREKRSMFARWIAGGAMNDPDDGGADGAADGAPP